MTADSARKKFKRAEGDPHVLRRRPRPPFEFTGSKKDWEKANERAASPQGMALQRLVEALQALVMDPVVIASEEHHKLAFMLRELLHESEPDDDYSTILEPLLAIVGETTGATAARVAEAEEAANLSKVRVAYNQLPVLSKGRGATALIARRTGLSSNTVRKHLSTVRAEGSKAQ